MLVLDGTPYRYANRYDISGSGQTVTWPDGTIAIWQDGQEVSVQLCLDFCDGAPRAEVTGLEVSVRDGGAAYASELFGEGHASPKWPDGKAPTVVLAVRNGTNAGEADVTFELSDGAQFGGNVTNLMWDPIAGGTGDAGLRTAPGTVVAIKEGGRRVDRSITLAIKEATDTSPDNADTARATSGKAEIAFELPRLQNLGALAKANALDADKTNDLLSITVSADATIRSGTFASGDLTGAKPPAVISARDS